MEEIPHYFSQRIMYLPGEGMPSASLIELATLSQILLALMLIFYIRANRSTGINTFVLLGVCLNISWEVYYFVTLDSHPSYLLIWLGLDLVVLVQAVQSGVSQLKWHEPALRFFKSIFAAAVVVCILGQLGYQEAAVVTGFFESAWLINMITSFAFITYFLHWPQRERNPLLPISFRFLGNLAIAIPNIQVILGRGIVGRDPWVLFMVISVLVADLIYISLVSLRVFESEES